MKKLWLIAALAVLLSGTPMVRAQAIHGGDATSDKESQVRALTGEVMDSRDQPIAGAIVYLKNTKTMAVKTYIVGQDGVYRFNALSSNVDYEVYAEHNNKKSDTKTLSSFDSRKTAYINLKIKG
ncbi:MAG: carboxypeptidase-like regulatory domain-containing protein [Acidobacteriia bacterium]|nr:carboxypeptidase-like regulatory domain-containing protein [Terriglobia bacterium]